MIALGILALIAMIFAGIATMKVTNNIILAVLCFFAIGLVVWTPLGAILVIVISILVIAKS